MIIIEACVSLGARLCCFRWPFQHKPLFWLLDSGCFSTMASRVLDQNRADSRPTKFRLARPVYDSKQAS